MRRYFLTIGISCFIVLTLIAQSIRASESDDSYIKNSLSSTTLKNVASSEGEDRHKHLETRILFLCTGNSCRSQIAEGWTKYLGNDSVEVKSAGIVAHGINPRTILVMKESGIDIAGQSSKVVIPDMIEWANLVITVCGNADETCPLLSQDVRKIHWPIPDPAKAIGNDEEIMFEFRAVSSEIRQRVIELLATLK